MTYRLEHPSGCDCPPPEFTDGGRLVVSVHTCPVCLKWERERRMLQVELFPTEEGKGTDVTGPETLDEYAEDPSEVLAAIRAVDPTF